MNFDELKKNSELQEKLKTASTPEELLKIAREEGYELSDEDLEGIAGGGFWGNCDDCPEFVPQPNYVKHTIPEDSGLSC